MGRWSRVLAKALLDFAKIEEGMSVLDVGCGTGAVSSEAGRRIGNGSVVGVDPSAEYIAGARLSANCNCSFEVGDGQRLPFPSASFDAAISMLALNFMPDADAAAREMARVTRPGGLVAAAVWDYGGGMQMLRTFWDAVVEIDPQAEALDEKHLPLCSEGDLGRLFKEAGIAEVESRPIVIETRFASFEDYWEPFGEGQGPAGAYLASLTLDQRRGLRDNIEDRLTTNSAGEIELTARAWTARGSIAS
jgi:ubiquinone/menaquinone biosynthesis C-methylase UbiE